MRDLNRFAYKVCLVFALVLGVACGDDDGGVDEGQPLRDIVDTAVAAGDFTVLAQALADAGLVATLKGPGPFTVFAPTDAAFAALPGGTLESLTTDQLVEILTYHVVEGRWMAADLESGPVTTVSGYSAFVDTSSGVRINGASVTGADIEASNGVIHVIDQVILPPDLVDAALLAGSFSTLAQALTDASLVDALRGEEPLTVFAPTDAAFAALPEGALEGLTVAELTDILLSHVVAGDVRAGDLVAGDVPTLLEGNAVTVTLEDGVHVDGVRVVLADIVTTNGVIHVLEGVLLP